MKRLSRIILGFVLIFAGAFCGIGILPRVAAADEEIKISQDNFLSVFSNSDNYSKNLILTEDIDFSQLENPAEIYTQSKVFTGTFDGGGYTISNLQLYSSDNSFGLFTQASNAVIKNLRIAGDILCDLSGGNSINVGAVVGYANRTTLENCEIASDVQFLKINGQTIDSSAELSFGGFVGQAQNCVISNSLTYHSIDVSLSPSFDESASAIGGIVGEQIGGTIENCFSAAEISLSQEGESGLIYCGGIVGRISSINAIARNLMFVGEISSDSYDENAAAIVGEISALSTPKNGNIEFLYWTDSQLEAFAFSNGYMPLEEDKIKQVPAYGESFFTNSNNWYPFSKGWDFELSWFFKNSQLKLQMFETFNFKLALANSQYVENVYFDENVNTVDARYGEKVVVNIILKNNFVGFYELGGVIKNGSRTNQYESTEILNSDKVLGYKIEIISSDLTSGEYSFDFSAKRFPCKILTDDFSQGGVKEKNGLQITDSFELSLSYDSSAVTVVGEGKSFYTFSKWELYYSDQDVPVDFDGSGNQNLEIKFGNAPFDRTFSLKAVFSDKDSIAVGFNDRGMSEAVKSISFSGNEYQGQSISVSSTSRSVALKVVLNAGYRLDVNSFENLMKSYYGSASTASLVKNVDENAEGATYEFVINMQNISSAVTSKEIVLPLTITAVKNGGAGSLLWLYITLPILAVLVGGAIAVIIVLRRRKAMKQMAKKKEEKPVDYKTLYM